MLDVTKCKENKSIFLKGLLTRYERQNRWAGNAHFVNIMSSYSLWATFCDKVMWCFVLQWSCEVDIIIPILPTRKLRFRDVSKLLGSCSCELWSWNSNAFTYNTVCIPKTMWILEWFFGFKLLLSFISCMIWGILLNFSEPQFPHTKMRLRGLIP